MTEEQLEELKKRGVSPADFLAGKGGEFDDSYGEEGEDDLYGEEGEDEESEGGKNNDDLGGDANKRPREE